jgi:hypothetical protein
MRRNCPNCSASTIATADLVFGDCGCPNCGARVRVNRFASILFSLVIIAVTVGSSVAVYSMFGVYAVIIWFAFPIGAIGFLKARYCPLTVVPQDHSRQE